MTELLLELFSEEIPARMQEDTALQLKEIITQKLVHELLTVINIRTYSTPRRITLIIEGLPKQQPDKMEEKRGPRLNAPRQALDGFLKSINLKEEHLEKRSEFYYAVIHHYGRRTKDLLPDILENCIRELSWPKSMRWGKHDITWIRPLKNILAIYDGDVLPIKFGHLTANNLTEGHRFHAPDSFKVKSVDDYIKKLRKSYVILDHEERKKIIREGAKKLAEEKGFKLKNDERLIKEVSGLVEWPVLLIGKIDEEFMDIPHEILITSMRENQKYFSLLRHDGTMAPYFILAANIEAKDNGKAIIKGNERVLRARLSDARFFWDQDRKVKLESRNKILENVTYHAKLGSIADKVKRITEIAKLITDSKEVERAAKLCKADLASGVVGEFPELQGIMGYYYAIHDGESKEIAEAIRDHYKPLGPDDEVPTSPVTVAVALADKIDTLAGMFKAGEKPTGSKDPYALRRAALGVIRIILENNLRISLESLFKNQEVFDFILERLKTMLKEQGLRYDYINAITSSGSDIYKLVLLGRALENFLNTQDGTNLLIAYRRAVNILNKEEEKDGKHYKQNPEESLFRSQEEKDLYSAIKGVEPEFSDYMKKEKYEEIMHLLSRIRSPLDQFFDKVMVNVDDKNLRENRLRLLSYLRSLMDNVADFSKIEG